MKRVLVTGANKGIGLAIVNAILQSTSDISIVLTARDKTRGEQTVENILTEHPEWQYRLKLLQMDVTDEASIMEASLALKSEADKLPIYAIVV
jgi:NAD(P)-dependent dehydrogenase (short-subunit alcohol dehydrogenase family)